MKYLNNRMGFTLIEILVVTALVGLLALISYPSLNSYFESSNVRTVEIDFRQMKSGIDQHFIDNRGVDITKDHFEKYTGIQLAFDAEENGVRRYETVHKEDPWGNSYVMYFKGSPDSVIVVLSRGANGVVDVELTEDEFADVGDDMMYVFYPNN